MSWFAVIPPLTALVMVILTRRVILSLATAVVAGSLLISGPNINSLVLTGKYLSGAVAERGNAYTLSFLILFGALAELIKVSGGIAGFTNLAGRWVKSERGVLLAAWALLPFTFYDNSFRILSTGAILKPLLEKLQGSKEKLAFALTITTGQSIVLIPLATAYVGYMVSLLRANIPEGGTFTAYGIFIKSLPWNFYSLIMLALALGVSIWGFGYSKVKIAALGGGEEKFTVPHIEYEKKTQDMPPEYPARALNLVVPVITLLASTIFFFWWTGKRGNPSFFQALGAADFAVAITAGTLMALIISIILYRCQGISFTEIESHIIKGGQSILTLLVILVLSWALSEIVRDLNFTRLATSLLSGNVPKWAIPAAIFLSGAAVSYVIGSSWATWALLMPMATGLADAGGLDPVIAFGAVWAGGSVGDSTSPLSDIPILVSNVLEMPVAQFAGTALPFALGSVLLSTLAYIFAGLL